jgi:4-hydroxybenzoate polyprenyltransferase
MTFFWVITFSFSCQMPAARRALPLRLLDALLYSSVWLAAAAAAHTAATLRQWPGLGGTAGLHVVVLVFAATLLTYNLDAALPFKHGQPPGASGRKAWQQRHRPAMLALAGAAALGGAYLLLADGWVHFLPILLPLAALAIGYSWPLLPWRGRWRAIREVPLLKVFLIAGVWAAVTGGLPALALHQPLAAVQGLLAQRFCLVVALAIVFDIRDYGRDGQAGLRTFPTQLGVSGAKAVALGFLAGAVTLGLGRGASPLAVLLPSGLAAAVILAAQETRGDYFFALLTDGVLLVQAAAYFVL